MINFQNARGTMMEQILFFHDWILILVFCTSTMIWYSIWSLVRSSITDRTVKDIQELEFSWTLLPAAALLIIRYPSLHLLYLEEEDPTTCIKTTGHQWYWAYNYADIGFDSYLTSGVYRLLDVENRLMVHPLVSYLILVTAADVLHSWTIPTLSLKADAIPGRVNKLPMTLKRPGLFFGQCSEICGSNHRFMPISLECCFN